LTRHQGRACIVQNRGPVGEKEQEILRTARTAAGEEDAASPEARATAKADILHMHIFRGR
jgi:hypothetical protein